MRVIGVVSLADKRRFGLVIDRGLNSFPQGNYFWVKIARSYLFPSEHSILGYHVTSFLSGFVKVEYSILYKLAYVLRLITGKVLHEFD